MIPPGYAVAVAPSVLVDVGLLSQHGNAGMAVHKNSCFDIKNTCSHNNNLHIFFVKIFLGHVVQFWCDCILFNCVCV